MKQKQMRMYWDRNLCNIPYIRCHRKIWLPFERYNGRCIAIISNCNGSGGSLNLWWCPGMMWFMVEGLKSTHVFDGIVKESRKYLWITAVKGYWQRDYFGRFFSFCRASSSKYSPSQNLGSSAKKVPVCETVSV